ncbi:MAG TPA: CoA pyrophosphatase [Chryseosolibacter sp.]|nr:CoA pyrophosphatase [Chryseosolibacter sp.]
MLAFIDKLEDRLKLPLPGPAAHEVMRAIPVGPLKPDFRHTRPPRPGAVLICLYESDGEIHFPLIKRAEYLGAHSGQVSLPGGKSEGDEDAVTTALREGEEEIGIASSRLRILGTLSDFFVIPSNFLVTPVVAACVGVPELRPDPREVTRILTANLAELTRQDAIKSREILAGGQFRMNAPHFEIEGEVVWGATAMILNELCHIVREIN